MNDKNLHYTPLHSLHTELGAKMVAFANYSMPVQYPGGIIQEHQHTRNHASLFDVSHMGQITISGENAGQALESIMPMNFIDQPLGQHRYGLLTNDAGGIIDDLMVTRIATDSYFLVVNAGCKVNDLRHITEKIGKYVTIESHEDKALIALQGPAAINVLAKWVPELSNLRFMQASNFNIDGNQCFISRSGYSGEDGVEISVSGDQVESLAKLLLAQDAVKPAGLGARDSLRLEAGLCLYGQDLTENITPVEANLNWAIPKVRRDGGARQGRYPGYTTIQQQLTEGPKRKRVGVRPIGKAPVRAGTEIVDAEDNVVGVITSGGFGPSINQPIAMGLLEISVTTIDTRLFARVRNRLVDVEVCKLPFVAHQYKR